MLVAIIIIIIVIINWYPLYYFSQLLHCQSYVSEGKEEL
jgi:hypothetical protein